MIIARFGFARPLVTPEYKKGGRCFYDISLFINPKESSRKFTDRFLSFT